ncbi:MAG TPA: hypothetical protein DHV28_10980 [Ignavibacteriales bacterium]|nr:hypothetical protein [Ignavibacteriales bacterium]
MKLIIFLNFLFLSQITLPQQSKLSRSVNNISEYIASDHFNQIRKNYGDLIATDSIFIYAIKITNYNYGDALLSLMLATVPYREVPIQIPLIKVVVNYPLVSADEKTFLKKNENLPAHIFLDSPSDKFGDKDKLAHFFGSAFLSYESNIFDLGKLIGYFVEAFEESFKVQSSIDTRDLDVNYYGRLFGNLLKENQDLLPSQIFLLRSVRYLRVVL